MYVNRKYSLSQNKLNTSGNTCNILVAVVAQELDALTFLYLDPQKINSRCDYTKNSSYVLDGVANSQYTSLIESCSKVTIRAYKGDRVFMFSPAC